MSSVPRHSGEDKAGMPVAMVGRSAQLRHDASIVWLPLVFVDSNLVDSIHDFAVGATRTSWVVCPSS
jgi:hypothetical protein